MLFGKTRTSGTYTPVLRSVLANQLCLGIIVLAGLLLGACGPQNDSQVEDEPDQMLSSFKVSTATKAGDATYPRYQQVAKIVADNENEAISSFGVSWRVEGDAKYFAQLYMSGSDRLDISRLGYNKEDYTRTDFIKQLVDNVCSDSDSLAKCGLTGYIFCRYDEVKLPPESFRPYAAAVSCTEDGVPPSVPVEPDSQDVDAVNNYKALVTENERYWEKMRQQSIDLTEYFRLDSAKPFETFFLHFRICDYPGGQSCSIRTQPVDFYLEPCEGSVWPYCTN